MEITQITQAEGNTESSATNNKSLGKRGRKWCFTLNNYSENEITQIHKNLENEKYIFGKEKGKSGTPHLQGYVEFKNAKSLDKMKKLIPRAHFEKALGTLEQNKKYCSKDGDYFSSFPKTRLERVMNMYKTIEWKPWQKEIIEICESAPDNRTVYYFYDKKGNTGKSFLSKYLICKYNGIIADGKKADIFNQVKVWDDKNPEQDIPLVLIDIPRNCFNNFSYSAVECLKNGMLYSGKYEGGIYISEKSPHVIIFANEEPKLECLSDDRWIVKEITKK